MWGQVVRESFDKAYAAGIVAATLKSRERRPVEEQLRGSRPDLHPPLGQRKKLGKAGHGSIWQGEWDRSCSDGCLMTFD